MGRIFQGVAVIACVTYLLGALAYLPMVMARADPQTTAQIPYQLYLLLPAAVIGAGVRAAISRKRREPVTPAQIAISALGAAIVARLLYQLVPWMFYWSTDTLTVIAFYAVVCLLAYIVTVGAVVVGLAYAIVTRLGRRA